MVLAAEDGRGELGPIVGRSAHVDQPAPRPEGHRRRRGRLAEDRVDHDVHRTAGGRGQPAGQIGSRSSSGRSTTPSSAPAADRPLRSGVRSADGDHPAGPQMPGDRQRHLAHRPARAEHDHPLAGLQSGPASAATSRRRCPDVPIAATAASETSAVIGTRSAARTAHHSARLPSTGAIPAEVANHTR